MVTDEGPFADLPAALVEEVLGKTSAVGAMLLETFQTARNQRNDKRRALVESGLLMSEASLGYPPLPTTCATDGSYAIERMLTADLAVAAAVAVEGLTPPSETRHWDRPRHTSFITAEVHHEETATVLRAVMVGNELLLATRAPHDLVMIDGTFTLPIIYFNQAISQASTTDFLVTSKEFTSECRNYLAAYHSLLQARRSDRNYAAVPKYSTRREIGRVLNWEGEHDDRGVLTLVLEGGELTKPLPLEQPAQQWHLGTGSLPISIRSEAADLAAQISAALQQIHIFYYKPHGWLPALRVEVAQEIAFNQHRLAAVVQGLKFQCATPAMLEPYPLYLADRTVKALARALPAFRQVTTQHISEGYGGDIGEVFFAMHGYRSESGV